MPQTNKFINMTQLIDLCYIYNHRNFKVSNFEYFIQMSKPLDMANYFLWYSMQHFSNSKQEIIYNEKLYKKSKLGHNFIIVKRAMQTTVDI